MSTPNPFDQEAYRQSLRQKLYGGQVVQPAGGSALGYSGASGAADPNAQPPMGDVGMPAPSPMQPPETSRQGGAAFGKPQQRGQIPIYPGGVQPKFDPKEIGKIKTPADMVSKMTNADEFMGAWEKEYGSIDQKYDRIRQELGERPDPNHKLSKQEKFGMIFEFGLNLIKASQRGSGNSLGGAVAQATGETFSNQRNRELAAPAIYDQRAAGIEGARAADKKALGPRSGALKSSFAIEKEEAEADKARGYNDEVVGTMNTDTGIYNRKRNGALSPAIDPSTKKTAQRDPTGGGAGTTTYEVEHGYLTRRYKRREGLSQEEAEDKATEQMRKSKGTASRSVRRMALDDAKAVLGGTEVWKEATPDERNKMRKDYMEDERAAAIQDAYSIDIKERETRNSKGVLVGRTGVRAPPAAEAHLRENPDLAPEFFDGYGYLPTDFWPE